VQTSGHAMLSLNRVKLYSGKVNLRIKQKKLAVSCCRHPSRICFQ